MSEIILEKLMRSFKLYNDLIEFLPEESLVCSLPNLPSNELGKQLWCVVGARNSYLRALKSGEWQGFDCPLDWEKTSSVDEIKIVLRSTADDAISFLGSGAPYSDSILLDLLEHEIQHQGQLIRYLYGLKLGVPESWKQRYKLD